MKMKPSMCALNPLSAALVKLYMPALSPLITRVINCSLQTGNIPPVLKTDITQPILKRPTLEPDVLANYRPISNLPFFMKSAGESCWRKINFFQIIH